MKKVWVIGNKWQDPESETVYWSNEVGWTNDIRSITYFNDDEVDDAGDKPVEGIWIHIEDTGLLDRMIDELLDNVETWDRETLVIHVVNNLRDVYRSAEDDIIVGNFIAECVKV